VLMLCLSNKLSSLFESGEFVVFDKLVINSSS